MTDMEWADIHDIESFIRKLKRKKRKIKWDRSVSKTNKRNHTNRKQKNMRPDIVSCNKKHYGINKKVIRYDSDSDFNEYDC